MRTRYEQQVRNERHRTTPAIGKASPTLKPWRLIATPHDDVARGHYQQAEFAADLWQVYLGEGSEEYRDPVEFFRRTYLTESLKDILHGGIRRITGNGGDPVIQLQTNFGGGKTHSMLALYHLFSGIQFSKLEGIDTILHGLETSSHLQNVNRVVLVGNKISPGNPDTKNDGTVVRTLWGELAWQLGGVDAYQLIAEDDKLATNPGDRLRHLLTKYGPCLILIDEWVAYARQLHDKSDLPAGSFETQFTFAQALTEATKGVSNSLLVVSLPASDISNPSYQQADDLEVGGQRGREALDRLCNVVGRVESPWRPASADEGFEIVRRRLFKPLTDPDHFKSRDIVAREFTELYRRESQDFPPECRESDYEKRIRDAYPIHPEIFDRLYTDWSTLVRFQRTRGVLRLMAAVIHNLWESGDQSPLILPASIAIDEHQIFSELTRYLPDNWKPIIDTDIDGLQALPLKIDAEVSNLGKYSACRRVARTIYLGSAPNVRLQRGIEDRRIKLGCALPGEPQAIFGDALRRLAGSSTYLYQDGHKYWYDTKPTVGKIAADRAEQLLRTPDDVFSEIESRLRTALKNKGGFERVHVAPKTGHDVVDGLETSLVVFGTDHFYHKDGDSDAENHAADLLKSRGSSPRQYQNTLVFLAPDQTRLHDLQEVTRHYLAWKSIVDESEALNLAPQQHKQAKQRCDSSASAVDAQIPETYQWLLVPVQPEPADPISWEAMRLRGHGALAERVSQQLQKEELMVASFAGTRLRMELDSVPLWNGNHVEVRQLVEHFARYIYLQRLRSPAVLLRSIEDGLGLLSWDQESFAYAESFNEQKGEYNGLGFGRLVRISDIYSAGLLVKPSAVPSPSDDPDASPSDDPDASPSDDPDPPKRFYGGATLDTIRAGRDAGKIVEGVITHLVKLKDAEVTVSLEIAAIIPNGAPKDTVRTVLENCKTLGFKTHGFEQE